MTHWQFIQSLKRTLTVSCESWHITFGGRCLNCGFDPEKK